jgi:hypothetical protein
MPHIHWVARGTGTPKNTDDVAHSIAHGNVLMYIYSARVRALSLVLSLSLVIYICILSVCNIAHRNVLQ